MVRFSKFKDADNAEIIYSSDGEERSLFVSAALTEKEVERLWLK